MKIMTLLTNGTVGEVIHGIAEVGEAVTVKLGDENENRKKYY